VGLRRVRVHLRPGGKPLSAGAEREGVLPARIEVPRILEEEDGGGKAPARTAKT